MMNIPWIFGGFIGGLLIVTVFKPVTRDTPSIPEPNDIHIYKTPTGCVRVRSIQVPCTQEAVSLNLLAEQHK
jgi:hypothetical protein